jgi:hypothetical protein
MADGGDGLRIETLPGIAAAKPEAWNALLGGPAVNPFVSHEFLWALEASRSVGPETGWTPAHLLLVDGDVLVGAAPLYMKCHSYGEYVFDQHWADAFARSGKRYYPKLTCASPFSPVQGPRILATSDEARCALARALVKTAEANAVSSINVNFTTDPDNEALEAAGFLFRLGIQYHWFNRGYRDYDDFLSTLASRKRKQMKRERREAAERGIEIRRLVGSEIEARHWRAFWDFYQDTGSRKWGQPYLTREFFDLIDGSLRDRILMVVAEHAGRPIAGALNFIGADALYGRYWGCTEQYPFLHFEVCYHQAIEFAIEHRLARVEAGAQGEHKVARGYEPVETRSWHWIAEPGFRRAIADYLVREREAIFNEIAVIRAETPFRKDMDR